MENKNNNNTDWENKIAGGYMPPQHRQLEVDLLAYTLNSMGNTVDKILDACIGLDPKHFYTEENRQIFNAMLLSRKAGMSINLSGLSIFLEKSKTTTTREHIIWLMTQAHVQTVYTIEDVARISTEIIDAYAKRELIGKLSKIIHDCYTDPSKTALLLIQQMDNEIAEIVKETTETQPIITIREAAAQALFDIGKVVPEGEITGIRTGSRALDRHTNGFNEGDLIIIAARPGMGKTAEMVSSAIESSCYDPIGIFSIEMPASQIASRAMCNIYDISYSDLRNNNRQESLNKINKNLSIIEGLQIYIDETGGISIQELEAKAKKMVEYYGVKKIYIDYLQLITNNSKKQSGNREQDVSMVSGALKRIAKKLRITIIAYSQLSRTVDTRAHKIPTLTDLRESGSLEQDADMVMFLWRPEYYGYDADPRDGNNGNPVRGIGYKIIAKYRNGETLPDGIPYIFVSRSMKWKDVTHMSNEQIEAETINNDSTYPKTQSGPTPNMKFDASTLLDDLQDKDDMPF